jgi:hypothetical protein
MSTTALEQRWKFNFLKFFTGAVLIATGIAIKIQFLGLALAFIGIVLIVNAFEKEN